jgi:dTDP-4-amino-4,6-dideoxygalactose transaminase
MAQGVHQITADFEKELAKYTGAPYVVCLDNQSNGLFLALYYYRHVKNVPSFKEWKENNLKIAQMRVIDIPSRTYPSVPCEAIHAGFKVNFTEVEGETIKGAYQLTPTNVWDSALRFTADMYIPDSMMCISFTGAYKHFKLSKGGAILLDDLDAYNWLKKARFSGRSECSYHEDNFDDNPVIGWNFYMMPELSARGMLLINQFYNSDGSKKHNEDLELPYPDLSKFKIWK